MEKRCRTLWRLFFGGLMRVDPDKDHTLLFYAGVQ